MPKPTPHLVDVADGPREAEVRHELVLVAFNVHPGQDTVGAVPLSVTSGGGGAS